MPVTSMRRYDIASTLVLRHFDVMCPLSYGTQRINRLINLYLSKHDPIAFEVFLRILNLYPSLLTVNSIINPAQQKSI